MQRKVRIGASVAVRVLLVVGILCATGTTPPAAHAVSMTGFSVTVTPDTVLEYATYTLGSFRTGNNESVTGYRVVFPSDIDASAATSPNAGDTVVVDPVDNRTVTVTLGTPYPRRTTFSIQLGNVRNPSVAGDYLIADVTFYLADGTQQVLPIKPKDGTFTILPAPYLSMTITTPDTGQTVDFGAIDPGATVGPKQVTVQVTSSAAYTITCAVGGDVTALGLAPIPPATRTGIAGSATFTDAFTLTPPWTTDPEIPLTATVTYTVTQ